MREFDVVVIGSGLAGLSCAWNLSAAGKKVLVLEAKSVLGGRTSSWDERGMEIESGLHRYLGFYQALPNFLESCGIKLDEIIDWINEIEIRLPDGGSQAIFTLSPLADPIATLDSVVMRYSTKELYI